MYKGLSRLSRLSTAAFVAHAAFYVAIMMVSMVGFIASIGGGIALTVSTIAAVPGLAILPVAFASAFTYIFWLFFIGASNAATDFFANN